MKLLLHTCCAPCLEYPSEVLTKERITFTPFFYNPNIQPYWEYIKRRNNFHLLVSLKGMNAIDASPKDEILKEKVEAFQRIWQERSIPFRCQYCYYMRLKETALNAIKYGFNFFSTTLLLGVYQNHVMMNRIGHEIEEELWYEVRFYYRDFREGFNISQRMAVEDRLYRQKFCGCVCSLNDSLHKEKIYFDARREQGVL